MEKQHIIRNMGEYLLGCTYVQSHSIKRNTGRIDAPLLEKIGKITSHNFTNQTKPDWWITQKQLKQ